MRHLLVVPLVLLLTPALPAAVGPERPVSAARIGGAVGRQNGVQLAQHGRDVFAIWTDTRPRGAGGFTDHIVGSRVDADGNLLDPAGIVIAGEPWSTSTIHGPVLLAAPHGYTLFWSQDNLAWGRKIGPDGRPLGPAKSIGPSVTGLIGAATNGDTYIVLALHHGQSVVTVDRDFNAIRSASYDSLLINPWTLRIASDGDTYLIAGSEKIGQNEVLSALRLDRHGNVLSRTPTSGRYQATALEWSGVDYLLTWRASTAPTGLPTSSDAQRLRADGAPAGAEFRLFDYDAQIDLAPLGGGAMLMTWMPQAAYFNIPYDVFTARVDGSTLGPRQTIASSSIFEGTPAVATTARGGVVLWSFGTTYDRHGIDGAPVDSNGRRTDGADTAQPRAEKVTSNASQQDLATLRDRPSSLVLWSEQSGDAPAGILIRDLAGEAAPRRIAPSDGTQMLPSMATNGETILATWVERTDSPYGTALRAIRLRADGTPLDATPVTISRSVPTLHPAAVAWNGGYYLIAFTGYDASLRLARMTADGLLLDERVVGPGLPLPLTTPPPPPAHMHLAPILVPTGGEVTFLVWQNGAPEPCSVCPSETASSIDAIRIAPGGTLMDDQPFRVSEGTGFERAPDATWDGSRLVVVWKRGQIVYATRVTTAGTIDPNARAIAVGTTLRGAFPAIGTETDGSVVIAWEEADPSRPNAQFSRIAARRMRGTFLEEAQPASSALPEHRAPRVWTIAPRQAAIAFERVIDLVNRLRYVAFDPVPPARVRAVR